MFLFVALGFLILALIYSGVQMVISAVRVVFWVCVLVVRPPVAYVVATAVAMMIALSMAGN